MSQRVSDRLFAGGSGGMIAREDRDQVDGVAHSDRQQERGYDLAHGTEGDAQKSCQSEGRQSRGHHDREGEQNRLPAPEHDDQQERHDEHPAPDEARHVAPELLRQRMGQHRSATEADAEVRRVVSFDDLEHGVDHSCVLRPRQIRLLRDALVRIVEAGEIEGVSLRFALALAIDGDLDSHARRETVGREQAGLHVERPGVHPLAQRFQFFVARGHHLEQVFDDEFVATAPGRARIDETGDFFEERHLVFEFAME